MIYGLADALKAALCAGFRNWDIFTHKNRTLLTSGFFILANVINSFKIPRG